MNNRNVSIDDICLGRSDGKSEFEISTFAFIKDWLDGTPAFTINTSGSTGQAKPVVLSRGQMQHSASLTVKTLGLTPDHTALVCLNTQYIR